MKKSWIYMILGIAAVFTACEPIEDRDTMGGAITAEQLNISATPVVKDGVNSNYIELYSDGNACLSSWDYGLGVFVGTRGTVMVMTSGPNDIIYTGLNADGSRITKTLTVQVDKLFDVDPAWELLCGSDEKVWVWDTTQAAGDDGTPNVWGTGGWGGSVAPDWWKPGLGTVESQMPGEGEGASMVFSMKGFTLVKHKTDGTTIEGTFKLDMTNPIAFNGEKWSIGKLITKNVSVLCGKVLNTDITECLEYEILKLTEDELVLSASKPGTAQWGDSTFWVFRAK